MRPKITASPAYRKQETVAAAETEVETATMLNDTQVALIIAIGVVVALIVATLVFSYYVRKVNDQKRRRETLMKKFYEDDGSGGGLTFPNNPYLKLLQQPSSHLPNLPLVAHSKVVPHSSLVPDREVEAVVVTES